MVEITGSCVIANWEVSTFLFLDLQVRRACPKVPHVSHVRVLSYSVGESGCLEVSCSRIRLGAEVALELLRLEATRATSSGDNSKILPLSSSEGKVEATKALVVGVSKRECARDC